jgi:catechol 2,3-dioxygenase-like lactoylglutathione lyase family enzyme
VKLNQVRLLVSDFAGCYRFYRDTLGLEPTWGEENDTYASFSTGTDVALALFDKAEMAVAVNTSSLPVTAQSQDAVAFIFEVADVDVAFQQLSEMGARFVTEPLDHPDWGIRTAHLRDPDGNLIELFTEMPRSEWSGDLQAEAEKQS